MKKDRRTPSRPSHHPGAAPKSETGDSIDANAGERLQRVLARAGVASRRACETLIEEGRVRVNGAVVRRLPAFVDVEQDRVTVDDRPLRAAERKVYVMFHKPSRTLTTADDPAGRRTVVELVQHPGAGRLFPVGRLDFDTTGLLLLTNDGALAQKLAHPSHGVEKVYRAVVKGRVEDDAAIKLRQGVVLAQRRQGRTVGAKRAEAQVKLVKRDPHRSVLDITLHEGQNRQIRRLLADLGHPVKKLTRITIGPLELKGLRLGQWRELSREELGALRKSVGAKRVSTRPDRAKPAGARRLK